MLFMSALYTHITHVGYYHIIINIYLYIYVYIMQLPERLFYRQVKNKPNGGIAFPSDYSWSKCGREQLLFIL